MDNEFKEEIQKLARKAKESHSFLDTEEVTKTSLIFPMLSVLGYDVSDHNEVYPEYTADRGMKKGEKVDIAILKDGDPVMLIECKAATDSLDNAKYDTQLWRYYGATPTAKFGILTNGVEYCFYTDLETGNLMDQTPFLEIDLLDLSEHLLGELAQFCKAEFDSEMVFSHAEELKYSRLINNRLLQEMDDPSDELVRLFLDGIYEGNKTTQVLEKYRSLVKRAFRSLVDDGVAKFISAAKEKQSETQEEASVQAGDLKASKIITTDEEMEAFYIVRGILSGHVSPTKVAYRDGSESYFSVLYDDNRLKPICRLDLDSRVKHLFIPDKEKNFTKYDINSVEDIYKHKDDLIKIALFWAEQDS